MPLKSYKMGSDEIRRNWRDVLDAVLQGESVMILRSKKPIGVIVPFELWDKAKGTLEDFDDAMDWRKKMEAYRRGVEDGSVERDPSWDRLLAEDDAAAAQERVDSPDEKAAA